MATLTINFTPASPAPSLGYKVLYRKVGDPSYITLMPNWTAASPVSIGGVSDAQYEGTIQSECTSGFFSTPVNFTTSLIYNYILSPSFNVSINSVTGTGIPTLGPTGVSGNVYNNHTAISGSISVNLTGALVTTTKLDVTKNGILFFCAPVAALPVTISIPLTASSTDVIRISVNSGPC